MKKNQIKALPTPVTPEDIEKCKEHFFSEQFEKLEKAESLNENTRELIIDLALNLPGFHPKKIADLKTDAEQLKYLEELFKERKDLRRYLERLNFAQLTDLETLTESLLSTKKTADASGEKSDKFGALSGATGTIPTATSYGPVIAIGKSIPFVNFIFTIIGCGLGWYSSYKGMDAAALDPAYGDKVDRTKARANYIFNSIGLVGGLLALAGGAVALTAAATGAPVLLAGAALGTALSYLPAIYQAGSDFFAAWNDYKKQFGDPSKDYFKTTFKAIGNMLNPFGPPSPAELKMKAQLGGLLYQLGCFTIALLTIAAAVSLFAFVAVTPVGWAAGGGALIFGLAAAGAVTATWAYSKYKSYQLRKLEEAGQKEEEAKSLSQAPELRYEGTALGPHLTHALREAEEAVEEYDRSYGVSAPESPKSHIEPGILDRHKLDEVRKEAQKKFAVTPRGSPHGGELAPTPSGQRAPGLLHPAASQFNLGHVAHVSESVEGTPGRRGSFAEPDAASARRDSFAELDPDEVILEPAPHSLATSSPVTEGSSVQSLKEPGTPEGEPSPKTHPDEQPPGYSLIAALTHAQQEATEVEQRRASEESADVGSSPAVTAKPAEPKKEEHTVIPPLTRQQPRHWAPVLDELRNKQKRQPPLPDQSRTTALQTPAALPPNIIQDKEGNKDAQKQKATPTTPTQTQVAQESDDRPIRPKKAW